LEKFYDEKGKTIMALLSTNINSGHCQGIIAGDVCQACDVIISHHCEKDDKTYNESK